MPKSPFFLRTLRTYLGTIALGNLLREFLHLPLYTIWTSGSWGEVIFAAVHCTGGDILIALSAMTLALMLVGDKGWRMVIMLAIIFGVAYTGFSEWLNVHVRRSWAYAQWMPVLRIGGYTIGLSPMLQWLVVPLTAVWITKWMVFQKAVDEPAPRL